MSMRAAAVFLALALQCASGRAAAGPWGWSEHALWKKKDYAPEAAPAKPVQAWERAIFYYKHNVSALQGRDCPSFPSCSEFTLRSMRLYGFWRGFFMGVERIYLRENPGMQDGFYMKVNINGENKFYDPPEANDIFAPADWRLADPDFRGLYPGAS